MAEISLSTHRNKLVVKAPFRYRDALKGIPGAAWNPTLRAWTYPLGHTPIVAVLDVISPADEVTMSDEVRQVKEVGDIYADVDHLRDATGLASAPIRVGEDWDHQRRAYWWGEGLPGVLYNIWMGGGKTRISINHIQNACPEGGKVLIVAPSSVCPVWLSEIGKHGDPSLPWRVVNLAHWTSSAKRQREAVKTMALGGIVVLVINYEGVWRDPMGKWVLNQEWDIVIADESHKIKSPGSTVSKFFHRLRDRSGKRICLSGTPLHNSPLDIYGQARFIDPTVFGTSFVAFRNRYAIMGGYGGHEVMGFQREGEFYEKFRRFTFSIEKDEVLRDVPEMVRVKKYCTLSKQERDIYRSLEMAFIAEIEGDMVTAQNAMVKLVRLQQVTSGFVMTESGEEKSVGTSKQDLLTDVLDDIEVDEPVVVFCRFVWDITAVKRVAESLGRRCFILRGGVNELKEWQDCTGGEVMIVQVQTGGLGIDMTRSAYVIDYSLNFSYGDWEQAQSRIRRPGQTRPMVSIALVAEGTIDERILSALQTKGDTIKAILTSYKAS